MKSSRKIAIVALGLLAAGAVRMPLELAITRNLRAARLLPAPLSIDAREKIGQTSAAVALGGLRTLVATFLNLRAYTAYTDDRWPDFEETFNTIVDLAPNTAYYWDTGSWQLAYNGGYYYQSNADLPPLRRREYWQIYVEKGRRFLERGIRNNPDEWTLNAQLGALLTSPYKIAAFGDRDTAYADAAAAYKAAQDTGKAPAYVARSRLGALARVPGKEAEALALGESLYQKARTNHTPTLLSLLLALRMHADPSLDPVAMASQLFPNDTLAYNALSGIWLSRQDNYPVDGMAPVIQVLERKLSIPWENSVLNPQRIGGQDGAPSQ